MSKPITRRLIASVAAAVFAAGLMAAPGPVAAAADVPTPDSQTLVYLTSGFGQGIVLCANPDDTSLWIGEQDDADAYCQWEQIGDDSRFTLFNPAKGMVLTGVGADQPLVMNELVFPAAKTQNFSWGEAEETGRALRWNGDQSQSVDAGSGDAPSEDALGLSAWRGQVQQTWNVQTVGPSTKSAKARSTSAVRVTSSQWPNQFLCAVVGDGKPDNGRVKLSNNVEDNACEWLPFGPQLGPFVLYNPEYGKVITLSGGTGGPLVMDDKTYPNDARELWTFNPKQALVWAGDPNQAVDAGANAPTTGPVSTRTWDPKNPGPFVWTFTSTANQPPTAVVTLGDSFMSGEGGRWKGNSNNFTGNNDGTDRAYVGTFSFDDPRLVYGASYNNGCNRSNSAESHSSNAYDVQINLACSGAETKNIYLTGFKGEAPQAEQLATVAVKYDVRLIALSIGGNDLGFADVIKACAKAYVLNQGTCWNEQQKNIISKLGTTRNNVVNALNAIRTAMEKAGYRDPSHYRIVLQSAPSPLPRSKEMRYPENNDRTLVGGCPFWNADADWARDKLTPEISDMLKSAAGIAKVGFLDLANALDGREVCSKASQLVNSKTAPPKGTIHEWARFLVSGATQGQQQESLHPSYFGQRALGRCLALYNENLFSQASCTNTPKQEPERMVLTEINP